MRLAAKIAFSILTLSALGFCVAFMLEEIRTRSGDARESKAMERIPVEPSVASSARERETGWKEALSGLALGEENFTNRVLGEGEWEGGLMVSVALRDLSVDQLEQYFVELMARDLEDYRAVDYAGKVLQEIARREPELGVALLGAMTPAEREKLVPAVARGWTLRDPRAALDWIGFAWQEVDGAYIDRTLQNGLYMSALDTLVSDLRDYPLAAETLAGLSDPDLKRELTELVALRIVRDGPEQALERLAAEESGVFDVAIMDAVAEQWAARDGVGAAGWVLQNEEEVTEVGVRSIAKQLELASAESSLLEFHAGLLEAEKRNSVAAEVARLKARREPMASADWVLAIDEPEVRQRAVFDALYEIGYDNFGKSVDYIDIVYAVEDAERAPVVYSTLKGWLAVDVEAVAGYLGSGRANLSAALSEELLQEMAEAPHS